MSNKAILFLLTALVVLCSCYALHLPSISRAAPPAAESNNHDFVEFSRSRRNLFSSSVAALATGLLVISPGRAGADDDTPTSIPACEVSADAPANCVSTASIKKVDLYAPPFSIPEGMSSGEAMARLKGAISVDKSLSIQKETNNYLKVTATRKFNTDEIEFLINPSDNVITFRSRQVDGPSSVPDFGANRKRLDELRRAAKFGVMGEEFDTADVAPREGALGQLKAFYGLGSSGEGFEDVI